MEQSENPYASPNIERVNSSWWQRLCNFFFKPIDPFHIGYSRFLRGEMVLIEGIGFVVDPANQNDLFAVSAGRIGDERRSKLIREEALRVQAQLAAVYPEFERELQRRELSIVALEQYYEYKAILLRRPLT